MLGSSGALKKKYLGKIKPEDHSIGPISWAVDECWRAVMMCHRGVNGSRKGSNKIVIGSMV
jgi:hypothetical protein